MGYNRCTRRRLFILLISISARANCLLQVRGGARIEEDTGQVTINGQSEADSVSAERHIHVTIFDSDLGPKRCRGNAIVNMEFPSSNGRETSPQCFNIPGVGGCGNFVASESDGCEAKLFSEANCSMYVNTVVFIPESLAVGGQWRSMSLQCGKVQPDLANTGTPLLQEAI